MPSHSTCHYPVTGRSGSGAAKVLKSGRCAAMPCERRHAASCNCRFGSRATGCQVAVTGRYVAVLADNATARHSETDTRPGLSQNLAPRPADGAGSVCPSRYAPQHKPRVRAADCGVGLPGPPARLPGDQPSSGPGRNRPPVGHPRTPPDRALAPPGDWQSARARRGHRRR